jgi:hypothetical protein
MEEKKYPIYRFSAIWNQKDYENNSTGCCQMFETKPTNEELELKLDEFKQNIMKKHPDAIFKICKCKYIEDETWVLQWFNHFTLNKFNNDNEAIKSFEQFVDRKTELNLQNGHYRDDMNSNSKEPYYCLMGAEDRYRWEVCHCEHCQKGDWTIINH